MLDLAWSEIILILLIALVVIGPKELPNAVRGVADFIRKARRMAGEFQVHVDEMMRESKLDEVKKQIDEVRTGIYDMKHDVERAVDQHGIREAFNDPFDGTTPHGTTPHDTSGATARAPDLASDLVPDAAPDFAPDLTRTGAPAPAQPAPPPRLERGPPAFVPPPFVPPPSVLPAAVPAAMAAPAASQNMTGPGMTGAGVAAGQGGGAPLAVPVGAAHRDPG